MSCQIPVSADSGRGGAFSGGKIRVVVDGVEGRTFEGIGGITSNGMSKLLMDYPRAQRDDILDLLFKPFFGASLQHLKVEIGSDVNTSSGTEPSHMRSEKDFDITRGYGLSIAKKAREINPDIYLDALRWGTPRWIIDDQKKYRYYLNFLRGARDVYGLDFDYLGPDVNEGSFSRDWTVNILRPGLDRDGFSGVRLVAADSNTGWEIADLAADDPALLKALYALNTHYIQESSPKALNSGKPLWLSEDLAPFRHKHFKGVLEIGLRIIKMYALGRMVKYEIHPLIEAEYPTVPFNFKGILTAVWPWTGHYEIEPGLWMIAHFTQFIKPGWKFIDSGCGCDGDCGYLTLRDDASHDYSIIIVNQSESGKEFVFKLPEELPGFNVWETGGGECFAKIARILPDKQLLHFTAEPWAIYSLTTTTGQRKGIPANPIPSGTCFSLPYTDDFSGCQPGKQPRYMLDQGGAFEVENRSGRSALCQKITEDIKPYDWVYRSTPEPYTLFGSVDWADYRIKADVMLGADSGYAMICGRVNNNGKTSDPPQGYALVIRACGSWELKEGTRLMNSGMAESFDPCGWNTLELYFKGRTILAYINGKEAIRTEDGELSSGQAALGSGYHDAAFSGVSVSGSGKDEYASCRRYDDKDPAIHYSGCWINEDGDYNYFARTSTKSVEKGAYASFMFHGTGVSIIGKQADDCGIAEVYLDGILAERIDTYRRSPEYRKSLFYSCGLPAGNHDIRIVAVGCKNTNSRGTNICIDAVEITGGKGLIG